MKSTFTHIAAAAVMAAAIVVSPSSFAGSKTASFQVSLTIQNDCQISANPLSFGTTGVLANNIDQSTNLSVTCTTGTPYTVALDAGTVSGSTIAQRKMANTAATGQVQYNLYLDAARTQVWGNTIGTNTASGTGNGAAQTLTVYGRVPTQATPVADNYLSTVTATVAF
ncbi:spore coat U domain-containing protein [Caballeronia sp. Lep1P3]|uniref:Csu type fimbrial protein n=1 Tax=Caballeronia sp. Lep1P3 TaxID=2878150 RepID=UPI001FD51619|nr:spore coat U domain-containing protein [Caballeronia sp. Lep1P3]